MSHQKKSVERPTSGDPTNELPTLNHPDTVAAIEELRATIKGRVVTPDDGDYDAARVVYYSNFDRRPAAIVMAVDATDVQQVIHFVRENGLELAVRGGGHSLAGYGVVDGGIVLNLSLMKAIEIDAENRTAWAEAGLTAGEYTQATAAYGLITGFGDTSSVGIVGITLGGGTGYLSRKYGLTIDSLLAAEIVTADGQHLYVDAETHPDLFWAIRGGGGNFGVVTRLKFQLHEVDTVLGGMLILPATPDIVRRFVDEAEAAPEALTTITNIMTAPPLPFLPAEYHGQLIIMVTLVYDGEIEAGERAVAPFRALATPIVDMVRPIRYPEIYLPVDEDNHPLLAGRSLFVDSFDQHTAETIMEHMRASTATMTVAQLRVLGGAVARIPVEATAFAHRTRRIMITAAAIYDDPTTATVHEQWASRFAEALRQGDTAVYVNFMGDEGEARVRHAYPGDTWDRLAAIKAKYDPANLFHGNQNIKPAIKSTG